MSERRGRDKRKAADEISMGEYSPSHPDEEEESLEINDDTMLQDLLDSLKTPTLESEKDAPATSPRRAPESSPKRASGEEVEEEAPEKMPKAMPHKQPRRAPGDEEEGREGDRARYSVRVVRMVVGGELLEDGDESSTFQTNHLS